MYAQDNGDKLPTIFRTASTFTSYWFRNGGSYKNLGLLYNGNYVTAPKAFYCLSGESRPSEVLAYDAPGNEWTNASMRSSYPARYAVETNNTVPTIVTEWK